MAMDPFKVLNFRGALAALCLAFVTTGADAQSTNSCADDKYAALDFWVGEWALSWTQPNGPDGAGENVISRSEFGD